MVPFLQHFEIPKLDKYKGQGEFHNHIKEFFMALQEVSYSDNYLLHLFSHSLGGQTQYWLIHLA